MYWGLTPRQQPGSYGGGDDGDDEMSVSLVEGTVAQWLRVPPADEEFLGSNHTDTTLSALPRHEMTSAVNVALNTQTHWWRKPVHLEETTDLRQVTD